MPKRFIAATGDGTTRSFTFTIPEQTGLATDLPAKGSLVVRGGPDLIAFDNKEGSVIGRVDDTETNTVNYNTGKVSLTFQSAPEAGDDVEVIFQPQSQTVTLPDYTVLSFDGLVGLLTQLVRAKDSWKDIYDSNQGQVIIQLIAYVGNAINYMIARRAQESYILTARLRSSLIRLADLLNYRVRRRVGARTTLRFSVTETPNDQVVIPRYTRVQTASGIPFLTEEEVLIDPTKAADPGKTYVDVEALQGERVTDDYVLPETVPPGYRLPIGDESIEDGDESIIVYTGREGWTDAQIEDSNNFWTRVSSFINSRSDSRHYTIIHNLDGTIELAFGDGVFGLVPPGSLPGEEPALIRVATVRTRGDSGNISSLNVITDLQSSFTDSDILSVSNTTKASGGDDPQTTEEIREQAPAVFRTGDRAMTKEDFVTILKDQPGVVLANVWGEHENDPPNKDWFNRIEYAVVMNSDPNPAVPLDWANPSQTQIDRLNSALQAKKTLTTYLTVASVTEVMLLLNATIYVTEDSSLLEVKRLVEEALNNYFDVGQRQLGESIYLSNVIEVIERVSGVHHVDVAIQEPYASHEESLGSVTAGTPLTGNLSRTPIAPGTVVVRYGSDKVVTDDGNGNLTGDVDGGGNNTIDYTTGAYDFTPVNETAVTGSTAESFYKAKLYVPDTHNIIAPGSQQNQYTGTLPETPVRPGSVTITLDGTGDKITDTGNGHLQAPGNLLDPAVEHTIDYDTGAFDFTLNAATDTALTITYNSFLASGNLILRRAEFVTFNPKFDDNVSGINYQFA